MSGVGAQLALFTDQREEAARPSEALRDLAEQDSVTVQASILAEADELRAALGPERGDERVETDLDLVLAAATSVVRRALALHG